LHGHDSERLPLGINHWDVAIFAHTHVVQGIDKFIVHLQAIRLRPHGHTDRPAVEIDFPGRHGGHYIPVR